MLRIALIWLALGLTAGAPLAQTSPTPYLIEAGDQLGVSVLEDPGLNTTVLVRPDGKIALPLVGTLTVEGLSPEEVQSAIRRALARDFVAPPTVTVSLLGLGQGAKLPAIYVLGSVGRPGRYEVELPVNILQALAIVGGPGTFAATKRIQVRRRVNDQDMVLLLDYESVENGETPIDLIELRDGDIIVVPERGLFE